MFYLLVIAIVLAVGAAYGVYHHQCVLRERAQTMRDAMRHRDFMFRLPTRGLLFGEKALQEALNDMGQEIQQLVAHNEVEAWQRLTRVLTHEIMNATTPILSVSQAYLKSPDMKGSPYEEGIRAIHDTSSGLAAFVDSYRKLTQLQEPVLGDVQLLAFCEGIAALYPQLQWHIDIPARIILRADEGLLRQVFINLTKNAVEAGAGRMELKWTDRLYVSNDGHTISDEVAREIFIPFFTTKPSGTGIGLSLSRQILLMQNMTLTLREHPLRGYNATFIIDRE
ncbi:MAG: sensor histidine kinase [Alloprevotella sp.]